MNEQDHMHDAFKSIHDLVSKIVENQTVQADVATKLVQRIINLEEHRDALTNRIINLESQLASQEERFNAHMELYHSVIE